MNNYTYATMDGKIIEILRRLDHLEFELQILWLLPTCDHMMHIIQLNYNEACAWAFYRMPRCEKLHIIDKGDFDASGLKGLGVKIKSSFGDALNDVEILRVLENEY